MKKIATISMCFMLILCSFLFAACGESEKILFISDFTNGNNNLFGVYGSVTDNDNKTVTLNKSTTATYGPKTYFEEEDKNFEWVDGGYTASLTFKVDKNSMETNQGFTWTVSINDETLKFVDEKSLFFRKYDKGIKVGYDYNASNDETNAVATSNESSVLLSDGWYTANFKFYESEENTIKLDICLLNESKINVFIVKDIKLYDENDDAIAFDKFGGIRYGWLSWMTAPSVEVKELKIFK